MKVYEIRYQGEIIYSFRSYEDALKKVRDLYKINLDDGYKIVCVEIDDMEG